jgi:hypothetical protein
MNIDYTIYPYKCKYTFAPIYIYQRRGVRWMHGEMRKISYVLSEPTPRHGYARY